MKELTGKALAAKEEFLANYNGADRIITFAEWQERLKTISAMDFKIMSEFSTLDGYIDGFEPGELVVISGKTGSGKTLFLQTLTRNIAKKGYGVCWFSYELTPKQFFRCFPELPVGYAPGELQNANVTWLEDRIWEAVLKYEAKAIMIDHMHYLFSMAKIRNSSLTLGDIARTLKQVAINRNIVIFLICHTTKIEDARNPTINDIRDSGMIAAEADTILLIWRIKDKGERTNEAVVEVVKSRRTGVIEKTLLVKKISGWLYEVRDYE